jgi:hypothetical protein
MERFGRSKLIPTDGSRGSAKHLLAAARDKLHNNQFRDAALWVMKQNSRARRFYERDDGNLTARTETTRSVKWRSTR